MKRMKFLLAWSVFLILAAAPSSSSFLDWSSLKNPVYSRKGWSIKDSTLAYKDGSFYIFFSDFQFDRGMYRCYVSGVKTRDFRNFSAPLFIWTGKEAGYRGMCSPNLSQIGDTYYLTYNSWGDDKDHPNQLFYAVSKDLETWDKDKPLAANVTAGKRTIDAAIAYWNSKYYLVYKEDQTPKMAVGGKLDGGWKSLGTVPGGWFENGEFIRIDGKWNMLVTDRWHMPCLRAIRDDGATDDDWANPGKFVRLNIPLQTFNLEEHANCAFLADFREHDGFFYLLYSGRNLGLFHEGDKHFKLAIARSKDLKSWKPAGK